MMKRTVGINIIISSVLGGAVGSFTQLAVSQSSTWYAILAIATTIGCVLNILCGSDTSKEKNNEDEEE
ncbi:MAG: hypothetical protein HFJ40_06300 [Clostridia bacterium]|nr:hypothetical protein [Clostridia bacterium]